MMDYERVLNTNYNFPHIDVYNRISNGAHTGYQAIPHEGYVMYDTNDNNVELKIDPETGEPLYNEEIGEPIEVPVIYYCTLAGFPLTYNFDKFSWVAVKLEEINK